MRVIAKSFIYFSLNVSVQKKSRYKVEYINTGIKRQGWKT